MGVKAMPAALQISMEKSWSGQRELSSRLCMNNGSSKRLIEGRSGKKSEGVDSL